MPEEPDRRLVDKGHVEVEGQLGQGSHGQGRRGGDGVKGLGDREGVRAVVGCPERGAEEEEERGVGRLLNVLPHGPGVIERPHVAERRGHRRGRGRRVRVRLALLAPFLPFLPFLPFSSSESSSLSSSDPSSSSPSPAAAVAAAAARATTARRSAGLRTAVAAASRAA